MKFDLKKKTQGFKKLSVEAWDVFIEKIVRKPKSRKDVVLRDVFWVSLGLFLVFSWIKTTSPIVIKPFLSPVIFLTSIFAVLFLIKDESLNQGLSKINNFLFYGLLLFLAIINLLHTSFSKDLLLGSLYPINLTPFIVKNIVPSLLILTIISGFFVFKKTNTNKEKRASKRNKWGYLVILILLIAIGFGLRVYKLDYLSPTRDEYFHLNAAKHMLTNGYFNYERAKIMTYSTFWSWKFFNNNESSIFWARLIPVIFGTVSIPLIYYLTKTISNRKVALISAAFLTFSPFHIGMSRYIREYILFFNILILELIVILNYINYVRRENKITKKLLRKSVTFVLFLAVFIGFYFADWLSTYIINVGVVLIILGVSFILIVFRKRGEIIKKIKSIHSKKQIVRIVLFLVLSISITWGVFKEIILNNEHFRFHNFNVSWFNVFFQPASGKQLFYQGIFPLYALLLLFFISLVRTKKSFLKLIITISFWLLLVFFTLFFDRYNDARYIFTIQLFFTILFSISIFMFFSIFQKNIITKIILIFFLLSVFSPISTTKSLINEKNGQKNKKQDLIHRDTFLLMKKLENLGFEPGRTAMVSPNYLFTYFYDFSFDNKKGSGKDVGTGGLYELFPCDKSFEKKITKIISQNKTGFFVTDKNRNYHWAPQEIRGKTGCVPTEDTKFGNYELQYLTDVGEMRGFSIFKWEIK